MTYEIIRHGRAIAIASAVAAIRPPSEIVWTDETGNTLWTDETGNTLWTDGSYV